MCSDFFKKVRNDSGLFAENHNEGVFEPLEPRNAMVWLIEKATTMKKLMVWVVGLMWMLPAVGWAQAPAEEDGAHRVAVVALDDSARSGSLMQTVSGLLDGAKYDVIIGDRLERALAERQVARPKPAVAAKFSGLANLIADGVELFFYKGNEAAIDKLSPVFDMGLANLEVLARRPDFADQIFQAGVVMIRAYKNLGQEENATAVAQLLVKSLPGLEPSPATAPPKIIRFMKEQREALAAEKTMLSVEPIGSKDCTAYINGTPVETKPYPVSSDMTYMVTMDCGGSTAPVWSIKVPEGASVVAPVASGDPTAFTMKNGDFRQRRRAEAYMRLVAFWSGAPRVLGVTRSAAAETEETVLFVRVDPTGDAVWSDSTDERAIRSGLARVLPEFKSTGGPGVSGAGDAAEVDWMGWSLVGGGAALIGVGSVVAVAAENRAAQVQCSPDTDYGTSAADCEGVDIIRFRDQTELQNAESEVTWARIAGYGSLTAGVGLAAWGVWRLVSAESRPQSAAVSLDAYPTADGGMATLRLRF